MAESAGDDFKISAFIGDGYTEQGYIKAIPKVSDAITFEFRPMTLEDQAQWSKEWAKLGKVEDGVGQRKLSAAWLAKKLVSWDVAGQIGKDPTGAPVIGIVDCTKPENLMRIKDTVFFKLFNIVSLTEPSEDKPEGSKPFSLPESAGN
jgi:hypothetical protein